jgi:D-Tyr-tRNAtyr deacylase
LIKDAEQSGALAEIYQKLSQASIPVGESSGIADINGGYGVLLYLKEEDCEKAMTALAE